MLRFGMPTLIELDLLEDTIKLCKKLNLDFIELNMNLPQFQIECLENTEYIRSLMEKYQIGFTIHLDENLNVCDFNKEVAKAYIDTVVRTIEVAKALDVHILNMHMNHGVYFTLPEQKVYLFEKFAADYKESWKKFRAICEKAIDYADIKICIENTNGYRDHEKLAIEFLLQSDVFGLTWDIGHSNVVANVDEQFIMDHKDKVFHFHLHDSISKNDHMPLGDGEIDLEQRLSMAEAYQCSCVVETKTIAALKKSVSWLRNHGLCVRNN